MKSEARGGVGAFVFVSIHVLCILRLQTSLGRPDRWSGTGGFEMGDVVVGRFWHSYSHWKCFTHTVLCIFCDISVGIATFDFRLQGFPLRVLQRTCLMVFAPTAGFGEAPIKIHLEGPFAGNADLVRFDSTACFLSLWKVDRWLQVQMMMAESRLRGRRCFRVRIFEWRTFSKLHYMWFVGCKELSWSFGF